MVNSRVNINVDADVAEMWNIAEYLALFYSFK